MKHSQIAKYNDYIREKVRDAHLYDISVRFINKHSIDGLSGFFSIDEKLLYCAAKTNFRRWFTTFVHEYCHFVQWKENPTRFDREMIKSIPMEEYLSTDREIKITKKLEKSFISYQNCELECEQMTLTELESIKFPIQREKFIQIANANVMSWNVSLYTRKTYCDMEGYPKIYKKLPTKFITDVTKVPYWFYKEVKDNVKFVREA